MTQNSLPPPNTSLKALLQLAGPIFVANIAIIGSGTIDTIMAGRLGKDHLAAIALGIAATISVLMGLVGILQGLSPIAGHHYGARQYHKIGEELNQSFWLALFLLAIGFPILNATDFWVNLGEAKGEVARMAAEYIYWTALALPACLGARVIISVNAAVSRPRVTMWVSLALLALKVPFNAIFMNGWLGFPAMGGAGAGVSFCVLNYMALAIYLILWKYDPFYRRMHAPKLSGPRWSLLKEHLHVGIPIGLSTFFEVSSFTLMAIFGSRFGPETMSAHQIVANMTSAVDRYCEFGAHLSVPRRALARGFIRGVEALIQTHGGDRPLRVDLPVRIPLPDHLALHDGNPGARPCGLAYSLRVLLSRLRRHAVRKRLLASRLSRHEDADDHLWRDALGRGTRLRLSSRVRRRMGGRPLRGLRLLVGHRRGALSYGTRACGDGVLGRTQLLARGRTFERRNSRRP